ncbi:MAG: hypothetical protein HC836_22175 [Richelia sp. RM2_1_2]|nr:hypothetical protein [Richelia sp. RM2_1_2]
MPVEWQPGDPLPKAQQAQIEPAKFERYSMDPNNTKNNGKWKAFEEVGYDVHNDTNRKSGAQDVINQLRQSLVDTPATSGKSTPHGPRFEVRGTLQGPNGKSGTLVSVWQIDAGTDTPRLITNWLEVHRK